MIPYLMSLLVLISLAAIAGLALNLQWGQTGLVNFGLFGFYMLGAYVCAVATQHDIAPVAALPLAMLVVAVSSALVSLISVRLADDYLAIVTLGFAECLRLLIIHEVWATRGSLGIAAIPRPVASDSGFALLSVAFLLAWWLLFERVGRSPLGRAARALRDDAQVTSALGKPIMWIRIKLFALGGAAVGSAGALHAFYYQYVDPTQFGPVITAYAFMAVIVGGRGSYLGTLVGAVSVVLLLECTRYLGNLGDWLNASQVAALRLILIGLGLTAAVVLRPNGLLHEYRYRHTSQQRSHSAAAVKEVA